MQKEEILQRILESLGLVGTEVWKLKRSNSPLLTSAEVIEAIALSNSVSDASQILGIGVQTLNRIITFALVPILGRATGGNDTWKLKLYTVARIKKCKICGTEKEHSSFSTYTAAFDGLDPVCRECKHCKNTEYYANNKDTYHKQYIDEHRQDYTARNATRRANKLQATPAWASLERIKEIYKSCPLGYHVDHIIPLISNVVCGLHVENNLQIITAQDNLRKSNKFLGDW